LDTSRFGGGKVAKASSVSVAPKLKKITPASQANTTIHIDRVEISEGTITNLEDFIFQLKNKAVV